jgi:hypothetical protein
MMADVEQKGTMRASILSRGDSLDDTLSQRRSSDYSTEFDMQDSGFDTQHNIHKQPPVKPNPESHTDE